MNYSQKKKNNGWWWIVCSWKAYLTTIYFEILNHNLKVNKFKSTRTWKFWKWVYNLFFCQFHPIVRVLAGMHWWGRIINEPLNPHSEHITPKLCFHFVIDLCCFVLCIVKCNVNVHLQVQTTHRTFRGHLRSDTLCSTFVTSNCFKLIFVS